MQLLIDCRETRLITLLNEIDVPFETQNLELGDIQIVAPDFTLIFERKAGNDLEASIKDGRYQEQKARLLGLRCTYILESTQIDTEAKQSAVIHTMYRDNMHVVFTRDLSETGGFIKNVYQRCLAHPEYFSGKYNSDVACSAPGSYLNTLKSKKSENINPENCWILQLSQIPGISTTIAKSISQVYPTMAKLLDALRSSDNPAKLLSQIDKIAVKKAAKILEFLQV